MDDILDVAVTRQLPLTSKTFPFSTTGSGVAVRVHVKAGTEDCEGGRSRRAYQIDNVISANQFGII